MKIVVLITNKIALHKLKSLRAQGYDISKLINEFLANLDRDIEKQV